MSNLVKTTASRAIVKSEGAPVATAVGGGALVLGGSTLVVHLAAALLPFGPFGWAIFLSVVGALLFARGALKD